MIHEHITLKETGPWRQNGWGPLVYSVYTEKIEIRGEWPEPETLNREAQKSLSAWTIKQLVYFNWCNQYKPSIVQGCNFMGNSFLAHIFYPMYSIPAIPGLDHVLENVLPFYDHCIPSLSYFQHDNAPYLKDVSTWSHKHTDPETESFGTCCRI